MKCLKCGSKLKEGATFCGECGTKVLVSDSNMVDIDIIRKKRFIGAVISFNVLVDNIDVGILKNGGVITCKVPYGKHRIVLKAVEQDTIQYLDINESVKKVEVHTIAKMGILAATVKVEAINYIKE